MTSNNFDRQRLKDIEDNLTNERELLKQFEDSLRYENDPRIKARYQKDVERQKQAIDRYQKEYQELKDKLSGDLSSQINHVPSENPSLNSNNSQQSIFSNVNVGGNLNVGNISQVSNSGTTPQPNPGNVNVDNRTININQGNYNENIKGDYIQQNNSETMPDSLNQNPSQKRTILVLAASPTDMPGLRLDEEIREIDEGLRLAKKRDNFKLEQRLAARTEDLRRALLQYEPQIVHFCGHGETDGIFLENDAGNKQLVPKEALTNLFKLFSKKGVQCVVLNACYSEEQAEEISEHIDFVVGMNIAVGDKAAIKFAVGFYDALGAGWSYEEAYELGCNAITLEGIPEELTPVLKKKLS